MKKIILIIVIPVILFSCKPKKSTEDLKKLFDDYYEGTLKLYPFMATSNGDNRYNDQFPIDLSDQYRIEVKEFYTKYLNALEDYDRKSLSINDQTSYDILKYDCEMAIESFKYPDHLMPINQMSGKPLDFPLYGSGEGSQPFKTEKDYDNWLARMNKFPIWCDTAIAKMKEGIATGWVLPNALSIKILPQIKDIITEDAKKSIFYGPINKMPESFSKESKDKYTAAYTAAINDRINPAYKKLADFLEKEYIPKSRDKSGISQVPNGKEYYAYLAKYY